MGSRIEQGLLAMTVLAMVLASLPGAIAGSQAAPEITDATDDRSLIGLLGVGVIPLPLAESAELVAGWVAENSTDLYLNIEVMGDLQGLAGGPGLIGEPLGILALYDFEFLFTRNGTELVATARISDDDAGDGIVAGGLATAATISGSVINLTVPKSALPGLAPGEALTALQITVIAELTGITPIVVPLGVITDEATGTVPYNVQFSEGGAAGDADGDGLPDAWEQENFGDLSTANASGDPDGDGLNNSAENALGTDPNDEDTDGDGVLDGADPFPLDPTRPVDVDGDGLPDAWEREHFGSTTPQNGAGDPDGDGLNNTRENAQGTDPNVADTDEDGFNDAVDSAPLDPEEPGTADDGDETAQNELRYGAILFAAASTFILLGLARGI